MKGTNIYQFAIARNCQRNRKTQKRDWILIYESSGDRDAVLASAQQEIAKAIMDNAEADDTFSLIVAGTKPKIYEKRKFLATPKSISDALSFLGESRLIGGLHLENSIQEAAKTRE